MFTGLHHAREPMSVSMNVYLATFVIYSQLHGNKEIH